MNPDNTKKNIFIGIAVLVVLLALGAWFFLMKPTVVPSSTTSGSNATGTTFDLTGLTAGQSTTTGGYTITAIPDAPKPPQVNRPLAFSGGVSAEMKTSLQAKADTLQAILQKAPTDLKAWINLGIVRLQAGDIEGARQAWTYVTQAAPSHPLAFANLGNLYAAHYKDYAKAETNYLKALSLNKADTNVVRALFELYTDNLNNPTAAEDILKQGIADAPKAVDLQVMLARYWKEQGKTTQAKAQYDAAIANAKAQGLAQLAADIETEKASF